jgi:hypothetical protein
VIAITRALRRFCIDQVGLPPGKVRPSTTGSTGCQAWTGTRSDPPDAARALPSRG